MMAHLDTGEPDGTKNINSKLKIMIIVCISFQCQDSSIKMSELQLS